MPETRLLRYPDVSRTRVVFVYAGDLWSTPRTGGAAVRLTSHPGDEMLPKFSPDGRYIAFSGEYDGNSDVYVIPATGGEPRRLTYHPDPDLVDGWTPDGTQVLFRSTRFSPYGKAVPQLFLVSVNGGPARALPMKRASLASFSPDGGRIAFTPRHHEAVWNRYRGGGMTRIGIFDLQKNAYDELPRSDGNDSFPMWHDNTIYFVSDRDGVRNLYAYQRANRKTRKLTNFTEFEVHWPSLGPDAIVFENGGRIFCYEFASSKIHPIAISVASDSPSVRAQVRSVATQVTETALSPSGRSALLCARGEIFTMPFAGGGASNITGTPGVREMNAAWSSDGKWIAYLSDRSGEYEICMRRQEGGEELRLTSGGDCRRSGLWWSPDSRKLVYSDKRLRLWYIDTGQREPKLIDTSEYSPGFAGPPDWSPDNRWIAYTKPTTTRNHSIHVYSLDQDKKFAVSPGFYDDFSPRFSPDGKYLYFLSKRSFFPSESEIEPRFGYQYMTGIFALPLRSGDGSPFEPRDAAGGTAPINVQIDMKDLGRRAVQARVPPGNYSSLEVRGSRLFYLAAPYEASQEGRPGARSKAFWVYEVRTGKPVRLLEGIDMYRVDAAGNSVLYKSSDVAGVIDVKAGAAKVGDGKLNFAGLQALVDPRAEWNQMFWEAWRVERDFFWDPALKGLDWVQAGKRYAALLPSVSHRSDLNYLIGQMIAELGTSHMYVGGGDMPERKTIGAGMLGADLVPDRSFYRIQKIYQGENWNSQARSPLAEPGMKVKEGDYLIAADSTPARADADVYAYFQGLANKNVTLRINSKPSGDGAWEVRVKTIASERHLRYLDWVESNRARVAEVSDGRVGYVHLPNTTTDGIIMFDKYLNAQSDKAALIVDERYNGGGAIPDHFTEKLQRRLLNFISPREGKDKPWPSAAIRGPKVMIINEAAGSGGDLLPWYFRHEKIGPLVGTRTLGGLVANHLVPLIDGGAVTAPEQGFWSPDNGGEWMIENIGVEPDYLVEQRPDLEAQGRDPQLEKAVELAMEALKARKPAPPRPKYPSGARYQ